jgi:hypothetical protein
MFLKSGKGLACLLRLKNSWMARKREGLAAPVLTIDQKITGVAELEIVNGRTGEAAKIAYLDLRDPHAFPSIMRTTSRPFSANRQE